MGNTKTIHINDTFFFFFMFINTFAYEQKNIEDIEK